MQETLHDLADILLKAVPTFFLVVLLHFYLKYVFFKPMEKTLHERYLATEGARKVARESLERASEKTTQYEAAVRTARNEIYQADERMHKEWQEKETAVLTAARHKADGLIKEAKEQLAKDAEAAKASLQRDSDQLATEIADKLLRRSAA